MLFILRTNFRISSKSLGFIKANEFAAKLDSQSFRANPSWLRRLKAREGVLNEIFNHKLKEVNHSQITDDDIVFEVKEKFESGGKLIPGVLKSYKEEGNGSRFAALFENLALNYFTFTSLHSADKFLKKQQIFGLNKGMAAPQMILNLLPSLHLKKKLKKKM